MPSPPWLQVQDYPPDLLLPKPPLMMGAGGSQMRATCLSAFVVSISYSCHFQNVEISFRKVHREQAPSPWLKFALLTAPMLVRPLIPQYPRFCCRKSKSTIASVKGNKIVIIVITIIIIIIVVVAIKKESPTAVWLSGRQWHACNTLG